MSDTNSMGGSGTIFNPPFLVIENPSMDASRAAGKAARKRMVWPNTSGRKLHTVTFLRKGRLYSVSANFICKENPLNQKRQIHLERQFEHSRQARVFLGKIIRRYGFPDYLDLLGLRNSNEQTCIQFLTKKCTFPRDSLEFVRQDKKIYNLTLRANAEGDKGIIICASYSTTLCFFNRYWTFCKDEMDKAVEVWRRLERAIGPPVEGNFFGFKFNMEEEAQ